MPTTLQTVLEHYCNQKVMDLDIPHKHVLLEEFFGRSNQAEAAHLPRVRRSEVKIWFPMLRCIGAQGLGWETTVSYSYIPLATAYVSAAFSFSALGSSTGSQHSSWVLWSRIHGAKHSRTELSLDKTLIGKGCGGRALLEYCVGP